MHKFRSWLLSLAFIFWSGLTSILLMWTLLLPYKWANFILRKIYNDGWYGLEKFILGLDYQVTGLENLPKTGAYIIAAKHQSTYETIKIKRMFPDAALILKKELAHIPVWGWYTVKVGGIPIDRDSGTASLKKIVQQLEPIVQASRPILIYPQGTRAPVGAATEEYPYKPGVALMAKAANLPIIPMRCDSGHYWPKKGWTNKRGGIVKFEIRPALTGKTTKEIMAQLEAELEQSPS